jgi:hypothetical protein
MYFYIITLAKYELKLRPERKKIIKRSHSTTGFILNQ